MSAAIDIKWQNETHLKLSAVELFAILFRKTRNYFFHRETNTRYRKDSPTTYKTKPGVSPHAQAHASKASPLFPVALPTRDGVARSGPPVFKMMDEREGKKTTTTEKAAPPKEKITAGSAFSVSARP